MIGTVVGAIQVCVSFSYEKHFECAAWWEKQEAKPGIYQLVLQKAENYPHNYCLKAEIAATVTDDYFPALYGGVSVSSQPYKPKGIGQSRIIHHKINSLADAIEKTGRSPGPSIDIFLDPKCWNLARRESEREMLAMKEHLQVSFERYSQGDSEALSSIGYAADRIANRSKEVSNIDKYIRYLTESNDMWRNYHRINCQWARDFLQLPPFKTSDLY